MPSAQIIHARLIAHGMLPEQISAWEKEFQFGAGNPQTLLARITAICDKLAVHHQNNSTGLETDKKLLFKKLEQFARYGMVRRPLGQDDPYGDILTAFENEFAGKAALEIYRRNPIKKPSPD